MSCIVLWALWCCLSLAATAAFGPEALANDAPESGRAQEPWLIQADRIDYDQNQDQYIATGNVSIAREGRTLTADTARLNEKTGDASAEGHVRLTSHSDVLTGSRMELNLNDEIGTLIDGTVFISKNHLYLSGHEIRKTGPQSYAAKKISITSCDGPDPAWRLTGSDFKATIEGYGTARHTALWADKIPVLYSPYLFFPVKVKRQSGLLMPEFGYSDRKGSQYLQPFFWAIDDSSDATFYSHFMAARGVRNGIEYRYVLGPESKGAVFLEGYQDRQIDDGLGDNSRRWGYEDDSVLRPNKDRYWFRMKHDQRLGAALIAKLDLDVVSDQDYLHEFKSGFDGFDQTRAYFLDTFGRDIDDENDPIRLNRLNLNRIWDQYSFNADLRWYDNVIKRRQDLPDDTLQQLPVISLEGTRQPIGRTPLYYDMASSYSYFYRIDGIRGHRADLYPRVYYPFDMFRALSVEPSLGVRQTAWQVDSDEVQSANGRDTLYRAIYDFKLDLSTEFYRIFDWNIAGSDRLKHTVTPEITYEFTPEEDQADYPQFDAVDSIERKNLITYAITNTFTARMPGATAKGGRLYRYNPFLRFKLAQSFDINKQNEDDPEPFSDIAAELDLTPGNYVGIDSDAQWSVYDGRFNSLNTALSVWDSRMDRLTVDYRYTRETSIAANDGIQTLRLDAELRVTDKWRLRGAYENNLYNRIEIERSVGVTYQASCWSVTADFGIQQGNQDYRFMFNLAGLGDIGQ
jgi:LPS-assembly protein